MFLQFSSLVNALMSGVDIAKSDLGVPTIHKLILT